MALIHPTPADGVVFMFAGQGTQYPGMTGDLYRRDRLFRAALDEVDELVCRLSGRSVVAYLYGSDWSFEDILSSHPALFAVQYALAHSLIVRSGLPDHVLGMSTGEFAAAAVGGAMPLEDAAYCVVEQARALARYGDPGGMLAIARPPALYEEVPLLRDHCTLALAGRGHFVVAGGTGTLARASEYLDERGLPHRRLPVRVGFHSDLIEPAREAYLKAVVGRDPGRPVVPLVSCCAAGIVTEPLPAAHLWDAISRPMRVIEALGVLGERGRYRYVDLGPGTALTILLKQSGIPRAGLRTILNPLSDDSRRPDALRVA
jgi:trans-AT polyketide synthase/acyltransferase/oxidoreductase domain-containing protein